MTKSTAIDSTYIKAQRAGDRPLSRRVDNQDHALTDMLCRPYALILTVGNVSDVKAAPALLGRADHTCGDIRCQPVGGRRLLVGSRLRLCRSTMPVGRALQGCF